MELSVHALRKYDAGRWFASTGDQEVEGWKTLRCGHRIALMSSVGASGLEFELAPVGVPANEPSN